MTALNHALTGAAIGIVVRNPLLVASLAFVSHFVLDAIPHFDHPAYQFGHKLAAKIYIADGILTGVALTILSFMAPFLILPILLGAGFAMLPDLFWPHYYISKKPKMRWFFEFHNWVQWFERPPGAIVEASYLVLITTTLIAIK